MVGDAPDDGGSRLRIVLGRASVACEELDRWRAGDVVELDELVGEPLQIFVSGREVAIGRLMVVDGVLGVRVEQLVAPQAVVTHEMAPTTLQVAQRRAS